MLATPADKLRCRAPGGRGSLVALAAVLALIASAPRAGAEPAQPLRLCADPTNLPFSSDRPDMPGLYNEIGDALGKALNRPVTYNWYKSYFGKRTVRVTLLGKQCDALIGLPSTSDFMGPAVIFSKPIMKQGYALVTSKDRHISNLSDLKQLRVAVQYESTPQNLLAQHDGITTITVLSPDEGMKALDANKADVAFIWGPVAGWLNKTAYNDKYEIISIDGDGLLWPVAIGFAKGSNALRDQVDAVLPELGARITELSAKYGLPNDRPIKLTALTQAKVHLASADAPMKPATSAEMSPSHAAAVPASNQEAVNAGHEVFNGTCAHCHGPDAIQSERHIDLRRLHIRYGDDMRDVFWKTVHEGRPAKGMPAWKGIFDDKQLNDVYAYLLTVQTPGSGN
jgi:ABC-type amino acid transport substrate-binding protein/cytochrome c5